MITLSSEIPFGLRFIVEFLGARDFCILAEAVHHWRHPEDDSIALIVQFAEKFLRFGITIFVHLEIVVAPTPGAIYENGAHWQIIFRIAFEQLFHSVQFYFHTEIANFGFGLNECSADVVIAN